MAEYLPAPQFTLAYDVKPMDIGEGYAKGIQTAGTALSKGAADVMDVLNRRQTAGDMLNVMNKSGMLPDDAYKAVMGKSLGAQESMVGLYAGQWIADQATRRQQALQQGKGAVDIAVEHAKTLDQFNLLRQTSPKYPATPQPSTTQPQIPAPRAQPAQQPPNLATTPQGTPTPLGSPDITNPLAVGTPRVKIGATLGANEQIPPGARIGHIMQNGQQVAGVLMPDGTFRPRQ